MSQRGPCTRMFACFKGKQLTSIECTIICTRSINAGFSLSFSGGRFKELFENLHEEVCMVITSIKLYIFISGLMILACENHTTASEWSRYLLLLLVVCISNNKSVHALISALPCQLLISTFIRLTGWSCMCCSENSLDRLKLYVLFRKLTWQAEVVCAVQKTHLTGWSCMCCSENSLDRLKLYVLFRKLTWQAEVVCAVQKTRWPSPFLECHWSSTFVWWVETSRWCWRLAYSPCWRQAWRRR